MNILSWLIPSIVSIVGFIVSYFTLKISFKHEIAKKKNEIAIEKLQNAAQFLFTDHLKTISLEEKNKKYVELFSDLILYGSENLSKIAIDYQLSKYPKNEVVLYKALLCSQLKYEISGHYISAIDFMKITISDFDKHFYYKELKEDLNRIINVNHYNRKLCC